MSQKTGWFRTAREIVVVVSSILLAFGIDAWWDGLQDQRRARAGLEELLQDLVADSVELDVSGERAGELGQMALWVLRHLGEAGISEDSASKALTHLFRQDPYQPVRSAYVGLRESAQLGRLGDPSLRSAIISYHETEQTAHVWRHEVLMALQRDVWEAAEHDLQVAVDAERGRFLERDAELARRWTDIPSDRRFESRIRNLGSRGAVVAGHAERLIRENASLRASIRAALSGPPLRGPE